MTLTHHHQLYRVSFNAFFHCCSNYISLPLHQVVHMNPYAALCNQMLSQTIKKLRTGEQS